MPSLMPGIQDLTELWIRGTKSAMIRRPTGSISPNALQTTETGQTGGQKAKQKDFGSFGNGRCFQILAQIEA